MVNLNIIKSSISNMSADIPTESYPFPEELANIKAIQFKLESSELYADKTVYGLFTVGNGGGDQFILSIRDNGQIIDFADERDPDDPIQAKLKSWIGQYAKMSIAYPASTYVQGWYNWWFGIVDTRKPQISSIELLPTTDATCRIISINNSSREYSIVGIIHLGLQYSLKLMVQHPKYFELYDKLKPGERFTIKSVTIADKSIKQCIIADIVNRLVTQTKPMIIRGCRQFTLYNSACSANSACSSMVEFVCTNEDNTPTKYRYFGTEELKSIIEDYNKKYIFKTSLCEYKDWYEIISIRSVMTDDDINALNDIIDYSG